EQAAAVLAGGDRLVDQPGGEQHQGEEIGKVENETHENPFPLIPRCVAPLLVGPWGPGRGSGPAGAGPRSPRLASFPRDTPGAETIFSRRKSLLPLGLWNYRFRTPPHTPRNSETNNPDPRHKCTDV